MRAEMPMSLALAFELGVVLMLIGFGARAIYHAACGTMPRRTHSHAPPSSSRLLAVDRRALARPLLVVAMYGGFQAFAALIAHYARSAERARDQLARVNADLLATRALLADSAQAALPAPPITTFSSIVTMRS